MANEVRLIDGNKAEAVLRNIADHLREAGNTDLYPATYAAADVIKQQRTIDPESLRPKGRWIVIDDDYEWNPDIEDEEYVVLECQCSECGERTKKDRPNYCDNCGAKMEG